MTGDQSRLLKPLDRVFWCGRITDQGTVIKTDWAGVSINWDNGNATSISTTTWRRLSGCRRIWCERIMKRPKPKVPEVECPACGGTGLATVTQPIQPNQKIYPARCKQCLGKGRIESQSSKRVGALRKE